MYIYFFFVRFLLTLKYPLDGSDITCFAFNFLLCFPMFQNILSMSFPGRVWQAGQKKKQGKLEVEWVRRKGKENPEGEKED